MAIATPTFPFDNSFVRELGGLFEPWEAAGAPEPRLLAFNDALADELGLDVGALRSPAGVDALVGNARPEGAAWVAQAYAGHQFGGLSPRLGDGRALLLGEAVAPDGRRYDLHLKGSGRTPFARSGDGKAAVGPMLREWIIGEGMHALGIPTSRALAVIATGEAVRRETVLPGAVLVRVAASHLRVGTFEYAARSGDEALLRRLTDYALARHYPEVVDAADRPALALLEAVVAAQASLIARWMAVGFVHGVMNTDNMAISGESIDYGPCAFMEAYDPRTTFSSIDRGRRDAYGNQPLAAQWNLARLAEALLPLIDDDVDAAVAAATAVVEGFTARYEAARLGELRAKLGLRSEREEDEALVADLLGLMEAGRVDWTSGWRGLSAVLREDGGATAAAYPDGFGAWAERWRARLAAEGTEVAAAAVSMDHANPRYVARNHLVEEALAGATEGDMGPAEALVEAVSDPFADRDGVEDRYAEPAPVGLAEGYVTFCGT